MYYGLKVTPEESKKLEDNHIDYSFWDLDDILHNKETAEIVFESKEDFDAACKLLNKS
jgi:hypothetical protein